MEKTETRPFYLIVQDWLAENIARGTLPAGARLTVAGVAQRLSVSRSPAIRAMDDLVVAGVLTPLGRAGYLIGAPSGDHPAGRMPVVNLFSLPVTFSDTDEQLNAPAEWERVLAEVAISLENCIPFGIYRMSESAMCDHFAVSRTVTREVLARLHERGTIAKDRGSHWVAGPLSARMLDDQHALRRLLEPAALVMATPRLDRAVLAAMVARLEAAAAVGPTLPTGVMDALEADLHDTCLAAQPNRRIALSVAQLQSARVVNRLFATHVVKHDESDLLREHGLVLGHMRLGDAKGAAAALRYHLEADHDRTRDRLKVLSVFADPAVAPYLVRMF